MLNLKKDFKELKSEELKITQCPVCGGYVCHLYFMQDADTKRQSRWFSCSCGVVFQKDPPKNEYDLKYYEKYAKFDEKLKDSYEYVVRLYAPLIEELIYDRRALLVSRVTNHQESALRARGWVSESIDKNTSIPDSPWLIKADFETYDFEEKKFGLIWFYESLECMLDPIEALRKAKSLLTEDGILFIASPDSDFVHTRGSSSFIHWKPDEHYMMWNRRSLTSFLEKLGFNVIMARQNYEHRFPVWDDFHLIAQRKFF